MTKKKCPLGEDCDLTTAWMAGRNYTIHRYREETNPILEAKDAEIERLRGDLKKARDVIDWALICWDDHNKHGYNMQGDWVSDARAAIAELTGGKDE